MFRFVFVKLPGFPLLPCCLAALQCVAAALVGPCWCRCVDVLSRCVAVRRCSVGGAFVFFAGTLLGPGRAAEGRRVAEGRVGSGGNSCVGVQKRDGNWTSWKSGRTYKETAVLSL